MHRLDNLPLLKDLDKGINRQPIRCGPRRDIKQESREIKGFGQDLKHHTSMQHRKGTLGASIDDGGGCQLDVEMGG